MKKLTLKKELVANLNNEHLTSVVGGGFWSAGGCSGGCSDGCWTLQTLWNCTKADCTGNCGGTAQSKQNECASRILCQTREKNCLTGMCRPRP